MSGKKGALRKFYIVDPSKEASADELAEKLISLRPVQEVFLTDDDNGFLIKTRFFRGREPDDIIEYISRNVSRKFGRVVDYFSFKK